MQVLRKLDGQGNGVLPWANEHEPNTLQPVDMHAWHRLTAKAERPGCFGYPDAYWEALVLCGSLERLVNAWDPCIPLYMCLTWHMRPSHPDPETGMKAGLHCSSK